MGECEVTTGMSCRNDHCLTDSSWSRGGVLNAFV